MSVSYSKRNQPKRKTLPERMQESGQAATAASEKKKGARATEAQKRAIAAQASESALDRKNQREATYLGAGMKPPADKTAQTKRQAYVNRKQRRQDYLKKVREKQAQVEADRNKNMKPGEAPKGTFRGGAAIQIQREGGPLHTFTRKQIQRGDPAQAARHQTFAKDMQAGRQEHDISTGRASLERLAGRDAQVAAVRKDIGTGTPGQERRGNLLSNVEGLAPLQGWYADVRRMNRAEADRAAQQPAQTQPLTAAPTAAATQPVGPVPTVGSTPTAAPTPAPTQGLLPPEELARAVNDPNIMQWVHNFPPAQQQQITAALGAPAPTPTAAPWVQSLPQDRASPWTQNFPQYGASPSPPVATPVPNYPPQAPAQPLQPQQIQQLLGDPNIMQRIQTMPLAHQQQLLTALERQIPGVSWQGGQPTIPEPQVPQMQAPQPPVPPFQQQVPQFTLPGPSSFGIQPGEKPMAWPDMSLARPTDERGLQRLPSDPVELANAQARLAETRAATRTTTAAATQLERQGAEARGEILPPATIKEIETTAETLEEPSITRWFGFDKYDNIQALRDKIIGLYRTRGLAEADRARVAAAVRRSPMYRDIVNIRNFMKAYPTMAGANYNMTEGQLNRMYNLLGKIIDDAR